jgi:hypothetical protein
MPRRRASSARPHARLRPRGTGGTDGQPRSPGSRRSRRCASRCRRPAEPPPRCPRRPPLRRQPHPQCRRPRRRLPQSRLHQPRQLSQRPRVSRRRARAGRQRAADGPRCRPGTRSCSATRASETSPPLERTDRASTANALDREVHGVPTGPAHPDRDAGGAGVTRVRFSGTGCLAGCWRGGGRARGVAGRWRGADWVRTGLRRADRFLCGF